MEGEWRSYRLEEICEFINGFAFKSTDYVPRSSGTIEVFRMGYIERGGGFKEDDSPVFVPKNYGRNLERYFLKTGDVAIAMTDMKDRVAILGNTARIRESDRFVLNQRVGCIRVRRTDLVDPGFLYYYSNWSPHVDYLRSRANSGVQVNLTTGAIKESILEIPQLAEQRAIAHILGTLDDKIELNRKMNQTLEAIARAIFKSWFVDSNPVRAKSEGRDPGLPPDLVALFPDSFEDSELGEIPKGWRVEQLGDLIELAYGKALKEENRQLGNVPVFGSNGQIGTHSEKLVTGPGIVVGRKGNPGIVTWAPSDFFPIDTTFYVVTKDRCRSLYFLFFALQDQDLASLGADSAVPGLNRNMAYMSQLIVPVAPLLDAFDKTVKSIFERISHNDEGSRTLTAMRDALLPKLLSGEIRVKDAETVMGLRNE